MLKVAVPTDSPVNVIVQLLLDVYKLQLSGLTLIIADSLLNTVTITGLDDVIPWLPDKDTVAVVVAPDSMLSTDKGMINNVPDSIVGELPPVTTKVNVPGNGVEEATFICELFKLAPELAFCVYDTVTA